LLHCNNKQALELQSLLRCNSKQASELEKLRRSSGAWCVAAASKPGSFQSLLRYNKQDPELLELVALQQASSGAEEAPEKLRRSSREASELEKFRRSSGEAPEKLQRSFGAGEVPEKLRRSSGACCVATASKPGSFQSLLRWSRSRRSSGACCVAAASKL